jgi:hypothetical protein
LSSAGRGRAPNGTGFRPYRLLPGIFLMEKVINLAKYSLISYRSPSIAVNQPAKITVDSSFF